MPEQVWLGMSNSRVKGPSCLNCTSSIVVSWSYDKHTSKILVSPPLKLLTVQTTFLFFKSQSAKPLGPFYCYSAVVWDPAIHWAATLLRDSISWMSLKLKTLFVWVRFVKLTLYTFIGNLNEILIHFARRLVGSLFCTFKDKSSYRIHSCVRYRPYLLIVVPWSKRGVELYRKHLEIAFQLVLQGDALP